MDDRFPFVSVKLNKGSLVVQCSDGDWLKAQCYFTRLQVCLQSIVEARTLSIKHQIITWINLQSKNVFTSCQRWNSNRCVLTRPKRKTYVRMYQSMFVQPDGSTIRCRYHEPRLLIKFPVDISHLSEDELADRYKRLIPVKQLKQVEEIDLDFDENQYLDMIGK